MLKRRRPRPRVSRTDRLFWLFLRRCWSRWADALIIVKPETVVRWHRAGFRAYWRWKSRKPGRPRIEREVRELIRRMAHENRWGAPRIHAELAKLGFDVSERTVSRYMPKRPVDPDTIRRWKIFLSNHRDVLAGMDFFTVPTVTFRVLYVFFVIHHDRRRVLHVNVTDHPTAVWIIQQLREAFPFDAAPRYLILDRDSEHSTDVIAFIKAAGVSPVRTSFRSPWQDGVTERWVGTCRREILEHVIVANEKRLRRLPRDYLDYSHRDRCHRLSRRTRPCRGHSSRARWRPRRWSSYPVSAGSLTATLGGTITAPQRDGTWSERPRPRTAPPTSELVCPPSSGSGTRAYWVVPTAVSPLRTTYGQRPSTPRWIA